MRESLNDDTLHPVLASLPTFEPDARLWSRIEAAHGKARIVRPQRRGWIAVAAAAGIAFAAVMVAPHREATKAPVAEGQQESQTLEQEWRTLASATRPSAGVARLHVIDAALQSAYDRGARTDEISRLWRERNEALRGLILTAGNDAVTRI